VEQQAIRKERTIRSLGRALRLERNSASKILGADMKQPIEPHNKRCPVCQKEYPEEDNYCGNDGSALKEIRLIRAQQVDGQARISRKSET